MAGRSINTWGPSRKVRHYRIVRQKWDEHQLSSVFLFVRSSITSAILTHFKWEKWHFTGYSMNCSARKQERFGLVWSRDKAVSRRQLLLSSMLNVLILFSHLIFLLNLNLLNRNTGLSQLISWPYMFMLCSPVLIISALFLRNQCWPFLLPWV